MQHISDNNQLTMVRDLGMILLNPNNKQKVHMAEYKCFCGELFTTSIDRVKRETTKSCGCYRIAQTKKRLTTHGSTKTKLYGIFCSILQRTSNPKSKHFKDYGARGITMCDEWKNSYESFEKWSLDNGYNDLLSLDRIENNQEYSPNNCRWTTKDIQAQNRKALNTLNTSGYRGVHWHKIMSAWQARITIKNKRINLGYYNTAYDAHIAYKTFVDDNNLEHNYK